MGMGARLRSQPLLGAAERRQRIAHGVSRGTDVALSFPAPEGATEHEQQPRPPLTGLGDPGVGPGSHGSRRGLVSIGPPGL